MNTQRKEPHIMTDREMCPAGCNKGLHEWVHLRLSKHGLQHADVFYCKWCLKYEKKVV